MAFIELVRVWTEVPISIVCSSETTNREAYKCPAKNYAL
jgi:hypothetical protein